MRQFATVKEGVITGAIGATAVAVWFLVVDLVSGQPFHTPATLGEAVSAVFGPTEGESAFRHVALYTVFTTPFSDWLDWWPRGCCADHTVNQRC